MAYLQSSCLLLVLLVAVGEGSPILDAIAAQALNLSGRLKVNRAAGCTSLFKPTYVQPGSSVSFSNQLKANLKEKTRECGWLFWTDPGTRLSLMCSDFNLQAGEYFILFDQDYARDHGVRGPSADTIYSQNFRSSNIFVGLQSKFGRTDKTFICQMSAAAGIVNSVILVGGLGRSGFAQVNLDDFTYSAGSINATLIGLPSGPKQTGIAMRDNILYLCGGSKQNDEGLKSCDSMDMTDSAATTYDSVIADIGMALKNPVVFAFDDRLWVVEVKTLIELSLDGGSVLARHSLTLAGNARCGAGNDQHRFMTMNVGDKIYYNNAKSDPTSWTLIGSLPDDLRFDGSCYLHKGKFYIVGMQMPDSSWVNRSFVVDTADFILQEMPQTKMARLRSSMGIVDSKVAVIGGLLWIYQPFRALIMTDTIEVFDEELDEWVLSDSVITEEAAYSGFLHTPFDFAVTQ